MLEEDGAASSTGALVRHPLPSSVAISFDRKISQDLVTLGYQWWEIALVKIECEPMGLCHRIGSRVDNHIQMPQRPAGNFGVDIWLKTAKVSDSFQTEI